MIPIHKFEPFRAGKNVIETGGTFETGGMAIDYTRRITFGYEPEQTWSRFSPAYDERFAIEKVEVSIRDDVWTTLKAGEYDDDGITEAIIDWRERRRSEWQDDQQDLWEHAA